MNQHPTPPICHVHDDMLLRRKIMLCCGLTPLLSSCATDFSRYKETSPTDLARQLGICSTSYATLKHGQIDQIQTVSGCASKHPLTADAIFQAASLTKPVTAFAALQWALAEKLDLAKPVAHYLPRGYTHFHKVLARTVNDPHDVMPISALSKIPLGTLLNHTSGLPNWSSKAMTPSPAPGQLWQYSGEGYMLLQSVLEAVSGQNFSDFMDSQVFGPLGMNNSSLVWHEQLNSEVHTDASPGLWAPQPGKIKHALAAASLYTTAPDYAKFLCAFLRQEKLLALTLSSPVMVDRSLGIEWGYGWGIERSNSGPHLWHWGNNPGFRSFAMFSPASGDGFVAFTNHHQGIAMAARIAQDALPGEHQAFNFHMVS
jgi:CubicO group peptidase (beta-lactamase class C family)